jgi:polyribonucleotide nucleotidyltransferase
VNESNFFPLTVDYREKFAAGGKVPGGFIKREGRPTDKETLTARLIDRAIRPLFPDGFYHDVHVVNFVISAGLDYDADTIAGVGSSAALMLSGAPFEGPFAEVRVGRVDGEYVVNPTMEQTEESDMDLLVAGKEDALVMVEGEAHEVSEEAMISALDEAHKSIRRLCRGQHQLVQQSGEPEAFEWEADLVPDALVDKMKQQYGQKVADAIRGEYSKEKFYAGIDAIKQEAADDLLGDQNETPDGYTRDEIHDAVEEVQNDEMRSMIVRDGRRIDGRSQENVRDLWMEVGCLPRVHVRPSSHVARRRYWDQSPLARLRTYSPSTKFSPTRTNPFISTTASPPLASARPAISAVPNDVRLAIACSRSARSGP